MLRGLLSVAVCCGRHSAMAGNIIAMVGCGCMYEYPIALARSIGLIYLLQLNSMVDYSEYFAYSVMVWNFPLEQINKHTLSMCGCVNVL